MSKYALQCANILVLVSCVYFVNCRDTSTEQQRRKHQRRSEGSSVDLTLSNTIDVTTEESNIWWPWASYEEWKQAHHFDMMPRDEAQADAEEVTLSTTEGARLPERVTDQIRSLRRVQHKRSKKNNNDRKKSQEEKQEEQRKRQRRREERKRKQREERQEKRRREKRKRQQEKREKRRKQGKTSKVVVDDEELEEALWKLLESHWGDYLNNEGNSECSNEIEHCRPKCLVFARTNSYICTCPSTHVLNMEDHRCSRK